METISLYILSRNDKAVAATQLISTDCISSPILDNGGASIFYLREGKKPPFGGQPNVAISKYVVDATCRAITDLSGSMFTASVLTAAGRKRVATMGFNVLMIAGNIKAINGGSSFMYQEDSSPDLVEYTVSETLAEILAQLDANGASLLITDITWQELFDLQSSSSMRIGYYRITDFATSHVIRTVADTSTVNPVHVHGRGEPLIVLALASNALSDKAFSDAAPSDTIQYQLIDTTDANPDNMTGSVKTLPVIGYSTGVVSCGGDYSYGTPSTVIIFGSTHNDGTYPVLSAAVVGGATIFTVDGTIDDSVLDGTIQFLLDYNGISKGIITYRKNDINNLSAYYDFQNVVYYKPVSRYDFSTPPVWPITINYIVTNGSNMGISANPIGGLHELQVFLNKTALGNIGIASEDGDTLSLWGVTGNEYTTINYTDDDGTTVNLSPYQFDQHLFYTFGNHINDVSVEYSPAADGVTWGRCQNISVGKNSQWWSGHVLGGNIFGTYCTDIKVDDESMDNVFFNVCYDSSIGSDCYSWFIKEDCNSVKVGSMNWAGGSLLGSSSFIISDNLSSNMGRLYYDDSDNKFNRVVMPNLNNTGKEFNVTGRATLALNVPGSVYGRYNLVSSNAAESVTNIQYMTTNSPVIFKPSPGLKVTFVHGVSSDNPRCSGGVNVVLDGSKGDWVEFTLMPDNNIYETNRGTY